MGLAGPPALIAAVFRFPMTALVDTDVAGLAAQLGEGAGVVVGVVALVLVRRWMIRRAGEHLKRFERWCVERGLRPGLPQGSTREGSKGASETLRVNDDVLPFGLAARYRTVRSFSGRIRGQDVVVMHYRVDTGTRKSPEPADFTIVAVSGNSDYPTIEVRPQRGGDAVAAALGGADVDVESAEFNRAWRVVSRDEAAAYEVLNPRAVARLLDDDARGIGVTFSGSAILHVRQGIETDTAKLDAVIDVLLDLAVAVPGYVRTDARPTGAPSAVPVAAYGSSRRGISGHEVWILLASLALMYSGSFVAAHHSFGLGMAMVILGMLLGAASASVAWLLRRRR